MSEVIISTNTDREKVKEIALDLEEVYRTGMRYTISEFINAFGGGINQTPGKDDDFVIPGPYISIELFEHECLMATTVCIWYKEEDVKMEDKQDSLIKEPEKKIENQKIYIKNLEKKNKKLETENATLKRDHKWLKEANDRLTGMVSRQITKIQGLKEEKNEDIQTLTDQFNVRGDVILNLQKVVDEKNKFISDLEQDLESKDKDIQALMDQLDARDREIEKYRSMIIRMVDDLYCKGNLDRGEEDLEDDEEE